MDAYGNPVRYPFQGGCFYRPRQHDRPIYIPRVSLKVHATVISSVARTTLSQTFVNQSYKQVKEVSYKFPLHDGVSVVAFNCTVGTHVLHGAIKTKSQANELYGAEVTQNRVAAVMDHTSQNDVFLIRLGNVPAQGKVHVNITFVGELKQDTQTDGIRYTIPHAIAPRYGVEESQLYLRGSTFTNPNGEETQAMSVTVDVVMSDSLVISELESPSHQMKISLGRTSSSSAGATAFDPCKASASLKPRESSHEATLETDFVLLIKVEGLDAPCAMLETHPTIPNQRAIMATLVPKFALPPAKNEIIFVIDRSGSMGDKIATLVSALKVFLKSLPVGVSFNICSFGSDYSFLWPTSKVYDAFSLKQAMLFVKTIHADMGGTNMEAAVVATISQRLKDRDLEVLILTDGEIFQQESLIRFVRREATKGDARFFSLGIGNCVSHSLIEGIARAGNGFCQSVLKYEEFDRKVIRMLKGALTPHINDFKLEVKYDYEPDNGFEHVTIINEDSASETEHDYCGDSIDEPSSGPQQPISLFDENLKDNLMDADTNKNTTSAELPTLRQPRRIQAPYKLPTLYPFIRTDAYLLMDPESSGEIPTAILLSGTSRQGPLTLKVPICDIGLGMTIHQLAARKAIIELEEESGWLSDAKDDRGNAFDNFHMATKQRLAERECQSLGIKFGVTGKYVSFVAIEDSTRPKRNHRNKFPMEHAVECGSSGSMNLHSRDNSRDQPVRFSAPTLSSAAQQRYVAPTNRRDYIQWNLMQGVHGSPGQNWRGGRGGGGTRGGGTRGGGTRGGGRGGGSWGNGGNHAGFFNYTTAPAQPAIHQFQQYNQYALELTEPALPAVELDSVKKERDHAHSSNVREIIYEQEHKGNWLMSDRLFKVMRCDRRKVINDVAALYATTAFGRLPDDLLRGDRATVVATLLVMGYLGNNHEPSKSVWELVHEKASKWVAEKLDEMKGTDSGVALCLIQYQISDLMRGDSQAT